MIAYFFPRRHVYLSSLACNTMSRWINNCRTGRIIERRGLEELPITRKPERTRAGPEFRIGERNEKKSFKGVRFRSRSEVRRRVSGQVTSSVQYDRSKLYTVQSLEVIGGRIRSVLILARSYYSKGLPVYDLTQSVRTVERAGRPTSKGDRYCSDRTSSYYSARAVDRLTMQSLSACIITRLLA